MNYLDEGDKLFIVLKGSVSIHVPIPQKVDIKEGQELKWLIRFNGQYLR